MKGTPAPLELASLPYPQTPVSANAWFVTHGICKAHWAQAQGLDRMTVVDLLRGRLRGVRGKAHRAAVALGLKANPANVRSTAA